VYGILEDGREYVKIPEAFCYIGRTDNPSFIGSESLESLTDRIWRSVGPSGPNKDYLYELAEAVRKLAPESYDSHLYSLETRLRKLDEGSGDRDKDITG